MPPESKLSYLSYSRNPPAGGHPASKMATEGGLPVRVDKFTLASMNRRLVLRTIWETGAIHKAEVARLTELSLPTVMKITDELLAAGLVRSRGKQEGSAGKRPEIYEFAGDRYYSVGLDVAPTVLRATVMDLNGRALAQARQPIRAPQDPETVLPAAAELLAQVLEKSAVPPGQVLGAGVGMPGILDLEQGRVLFSPNFHWENVELLAPLRRLLAAQTGARFPFRLENSNRALALGEQFFGSGVGYDYFICINLGYGIGAAAIENGELCVGASGTAGELGHITVEKDGPLCTCGNHGCLEAVASGRAIAQQARNLIASGVKTQILALAGGDPEKIEARTVFAAAREQDAAALDLVRRAGEYIGIGVASYINLLDPEQIVFAGGMSHEPLLMEQIQRVLKIRRMRFAGRRVMLRSSGLGEYGTAIGAAAMWLKTLLDHGGLPPLKEQEEAV